MFAFTTTVGEGLKEMITDAVEDPQPLVAVIE
jgi:hypothetical protein